MVATRRAQRCQIAHIVLARVCLKRFGYANTPWNYANGDEYLRLGIPQTVNSGFILIHLCSTFRLLSCVRGQRIVNEHGIKGFVIPTK